MAHPLVLLAVAAGVLLGCGNSGAGAGDAAAPDVPVGSSATDAGSDAALRWIITASALDSIRAQDGGAPIAEAFFDNPQTYVLGGLEKPTSVPAHATIAMGFTSYGSFDASCGDGGVERIGGLHDALAAGMDPRIGAVIYDNENWCLTPAEEQIAPAKYEALAAADVHAGALRFISTPATDLVKAIEPGYAGMIYPEFLNLRIAAGAAKVADMLDVQAQGAVPTQGSLSGFTSFVTAASSQAKNANANVVVLAGISTNPSSGDPSSYTLCEAVMQTRAIVSGYWLNVPSPGQACPKCNPPRPDIAVNLLAQLQAEACDPNVTP